MRTAFTLLTLLAATPAFAIDTLILASQPTTYALDLQATLLASGQFNNVDIWDAGAINPTLGDLLDYEVVYLQYDAIYFGRQVLGNTVADYVDAGGGVVDPIFDWGIPGLTGRFRTAFYHPFEPAAQPYSIDDRVASNTGGLSGPYISGIFNAELPVVTGTATLFASYDDGNPFIAYHAPSGAGVVVGVNDYSISNNVGRTDFWDVTSDGATLWAAVGVLAASGGGAPANLRTQATGQCGGRVEITTTNATPNGRLAIASGNPNGSSTIPGGPCAGRSLPVRNPVLRQFSRADAQGRDVLTIPNLGAGACGATYVVVDLGSCEVASATMPQ